MFEDGISEERMLHKARTLFEDALDWHEAFYTEAQEDFNFRDGHQWANDDLEILREEGRPALTFNLCRSRVNHWVGGHEDNRMEATAQPVDGDDQFASDIVNKLVRALRKKNRAGQQDNRVFEDGVVCGHGSSHLEVEPDPENPTWIRIREPRIDPLEIKWDIASQEFDRTDARYLFWDRWLSREEFITEFPDLRGEIDELMELRDEHGQRKYFDTPAKWGIPRPDRYRRTSDLIYYDRKKDMIRLVHMEYKKAVKRTFLVNSFTGEAAEVDPDLAPSLLDLYPDDLEPLEIWDEQVQWLEFIGDRVLFDEPSPMPYDGFSVDTFTCYIDYESGLPYGVMRDLKDPQREINKRHSQMLEFLNQQQQPGTFAEANAVTDQDEFEDSLHERGSVTWLNAGGLERVRERSVPQMPDAPMRLFETGLQMVEIVSGVFTDELRSPRGIPEAAATAQLKHRKGLLSQMPIFENFQNYQLMRRKKEIQVITRSMPDEQIEAILGNERQYLVQDGIVIDQKHGFELDIRDLRDLVWDVELEVADANNSQRLLEQGQLRELAAAGIPVDPEILLELTTLSAEKKARLGVFARQASQQAGAAEAEKAEFLRQQLQMNAASDMAAQRVKAAEGAEKARHNRVTELTKLLEITGQTDESLLNMLVKLDASEKAALSKMFVALQSRQAARERPQLGAGQAAAA